MKRTVMITVALFAAPVLAEGGVVERLLEEYRAAGAAMPSSEAGRRLWTQEISRGQETRSCASCHTADLRKEGRHAETGRSIRPLAPSVNARRLTEAAKIEKWFGRNCKWTYGRACTPEEKGHFLSYISTQ